MSYTRCVSRVDSYVVLYNIMYVYARKIMESSDVNASAYFHLDQVQCILEFCSSLTQK